MECGSVAQVAEQEGIPWLILIVISDSSDNTADISFTKFIELYKYVSSKLLYVLLKNLENAPLYIDDTPSLSIFDLRAKRNIHGDEIIAILKK